MDLETINQFGLYFDADVERLGTETNAIVSIVLRSTQQLILPAQIDLPIRIAPLVILLRLDPPVELL